MPEIRYLIVIAGESNSGGTVPSAGLLASDRMPVPWVRMWNNNTNGFEPLQIGTNNLIGHNGFFPSNCNAGLECGLIRDEQVLSQNEIYLVKSGHGGSRIAEWAANAPVPNPVAGHPVLTENYRTILLRRITAAKQAIEAQGFTVKPVFAWWLGLNDAGNGSTQMPTPAATWKAGVEDLFASVRSVLGAATPIFPLKLMTCKPNITPPLTVTAASIVVNARIALNAEIDAMAVSDPLLFPVNIPNGVGIHADGSHYTLHGYISAWNALADRLIETNAVIPQRTRIVRPSRRNAPIFTMAHISGRALANARSSTIATMPMTPVADPDGCFFDDGINQGFRVPDWGSGNYQIEFWAGFSAGCTQVVVNACKNGLVGLKSPVLITAIDSIYSNGGTGKGYSLIPGDKITLAVAQSNSASLSRSFATDQLRPTLSIYRLDI